MKLNYNFPQIIPHYQTNFTIKRTIFFLMENMQSFHFYQTWPH